MRFEKLNENKIRITLNHDDLIEKDIDFHSFMSNSLESQELFFDMLEEAEKEIGFSTKDYLIKIEALAMVGGDFVLTITRSLPKKEKSNFLVGNKISKHPKNIHIKRKNISNDSFELVYLFNCFEDYCSFIELYKNTFKAYNFAKKVLLYEYDNKYYLVLIEINTIFPELKKLLSCITEFGTCVSHSDIFIRKLFENGNLIMKHNAVLTSLKHFAK